MTTMISAPLPAPPSSVAPTAPSTTPIDGAHGDDDTSTGDGESSHDFGEVFAAIALVAAAAPTADPATGDADASDAPEDGAVTAVSADPGGRAPGADRSGPDAPGQSGLARLLASLVGRPGTGPQPGARDMPGAPPHAVGAETPGGTVGDLGLPDGAVRTTIDANAARSVASGLQARVAALLAADPAASVSENSVTMTDEADADSATGELLGTDSTGDAAANTGSASSATVNPGDRVVPAHAVANGLERPTTIDEGLTSLETVAGTVGTMGRGTERFDLLAATRSVAPRSIQLDLGDEGLGELLVTATRERGAVNLVVNAADDRTRDAINQQRDELLDDLDAAGVELGTLDIRGGEGDRNTEPSGAIGTSRDDQAHAGDSDSGEPDTELHPTHGRTDTLLDLRL